MVIAAGASSLLRAGTSGLCRETGLGRCGLDSAAEKWAGGCYSRYWCDNGRWKFFFFVLVCIFLKGVAPA